jgi:hypothetical protein
MKRFMPVAIVVFALIACLSACDHTQAIPGSAGESYVAMATHSSAGEALGLSLFRRRPGRRSARFVAAGRHRAFRSPVSARRVSRCAVTKRQCNSRRAGKRVASTQVRFDTAG